MNSDEINPVLRELQRLWLLAGRPSTRTIAGRCKRNVSHATVAVYLKGMIERPTWATIEMIGEALTNSDDELARLREAWRDWVTSLGPDQPRSDPRTDAINNLATAISNLADAIRAAKL